MTTKQKIGGSPVVINILILSYKCKYAETFLNDETEFSMWVFLLVCEATPDGVQPLYLALHS